MQDSNNVRKGFIDSLSEKLMPVAAFMNTQRHMVAVKDSFITIMPLILVFSFFILLDSLIFSNATINSWVDLSFLKPLTSKVYNGTMALMSVFIAFLIPYKLASYERAEQKTPALQTGFVGVASFVTMLPTVFQITPVGMADPVNIQGAMSFEYTSSSGLFIAMLLGLISYELLSRLFRMPSLKIRMPEDVPPAIAQSFNSLIPSFIVVAVIGLIAITIEGVFNTSLPEIITHLIQKPLESLVQNPIGMLVIFFCQNLLWVLGVHGASIMAPLTSPTLLAALDQNLQAFNNGEIIPNIVTSPFLDSYNLMTPVALIIAVLMVSKVQSMRSIGKMGAVPALFNISEPVMFGMPVVMNPMLMIPYLIAPFVNLIIAYYLTVIGVIGKAYIQVPWTTPLGLQSYLSTGGDILAGLLAIGLLVIDVIIFIPFIMAINKAQAKQATIQDTNHG